MDDVWKALTLLIALLVTSIALQQWWINKEKLRLDLFDRRYAVFEAVRAFVISILQECKVDPAKRRQYWSGTADATFLFDKDVLDYIKEIGDQAKAYSRHLRNWDKADSSEEHSDLALEVEMWFEKQLTNDVLENVFGRYLRFQDLQGPITVARRRFASWVCRIWRKLKRTDRST